MSEMIERVAKALDASGCFGVSLAFTEDAGNDTPTIKACRLSDTARALSAARIAIETMRIPAPPMAAVACDEINTWGIGSFECVAIYTTMIDEALK